MRLLSMSGVAFVGCFAVAAALYGSGAGSSAREIAAYYASGAGGRQIAGFAVLLAGTICLLLYVAALRQALVREEPFATVALASGVAAAVLLLAANALWAATAFAVELEPDGYRPDPGTHLLVEDAAFVLLVTAAAAAIPFAVAATLAARRSGWPAWFGVLGALAAAGLAAAYWYVPLALFLAWVAAGSVRLALVGPGGERRR